MAIEKTSRIFSVEQNASVGTLTITANDEGLGLKPLTMHVERMSDANRMLATLLGVKNKIVDTAAKAMGTPASEKHAAMAATIERLEKEDGEWNSRVARGGGNEDAMLVTALMEVMKCDDRAKTAGIVKAWSADKRNAIRARADVKIVLDRLIEQSAADVDTDELLMEAFA